MTLRSVQIGDLPHLHRWYNSPQAMGDYDEATFPAFTRVEAKFCDGGFKTTWVIECDGRPIGFANFAVHPWDDWIAVIGVIIAEPDFRGRGIGTEVHRLLAREIFASAPEIQKLEALTDVENLAETRALTKAGFHREGTLLRKNRLRGEFRDMHQFCLLR